MTAIDDTNLNGSDQAPTHAALHLVHLCAVVAANKQIGSVIHDACDVIRSILRGDVKPDDDVLKAAFVGAKLRFHPFAAPRAASNSSRRTSTANRANRSDPNDDTDSYGSYGSYNTKDSHNARDTAAAEAEAKRIEDKYASISSPALMQRALDAFAATKAAEAAAAAASEASIAPAESFAPAEAIAPAPATITINGIPAPSIDPETGKPFAPAPDHATYCKGKPTEAQFRHLEARFGYPLSRNDNINNPYMFQRLEDDFYALFAKRLKAQRALERQLQEENSYSNPAT